MPPDCSAGFPETPAAPFMMRPSPSAALTSASIVERHARSSVLHHLRTTDVRSRRTPWASTDGLGVPRGPHRSSRVRTSVRAALDVDDGGFTRDGRLFDHRVERRQLQPSDVREARERKREYVPASIKAWLGDGNPTAFNEGRTCRFNAPQAGRPRCCRPLPRWLCADASAGRKTRVATNKNELYADDGVNKKNERPCLWSSVVRWQSARPECSARFGPNFSASRQVANLTQVH